MEKISKNKREARDEKNREQKLEELVLKTLDDCSNPEERFKLLLQRHITSEKNNNRITNEMRAMQRQMENQLREKEQMQKELNKSVLMRDKLQEVCREQQRIIKSVKNESMLQIKVEEERRKESQTKFQSSLNEITQSLSKNNEENKKLRDYNIEMTKKLKALAEQYQTREKHLEKLNEQVQLESQLHQAKLNKAQVEAAMEREILTKENQIGLEKLLQAQRAIKELTEREHQMKEQLNIYTTKYDDFQQSLQKSNEVFANYKQELEKMSKHTKKMEKEAVTWRQKYEKANGLLIELATEKQVRDQHAERCNKQVDQLQKLLRALQLERTALHKQLRDHNIEIPPVPTLPPEPEPMKIEPINHEKDKMELMTRNCAELKETLANLQNQMKLLTTTDKNTVQRPKASEHVDNKAKDSAEQPKAKKNNKKKNKAKGKAAAGAAGAEAPTSNAKAPVEPQAESNIVPKDLMSQEEQVPENEPKPSAVVTANTDALTATQTDGAGDGPKVDAFKAQVCEDSSQSREIVGEGDFVVVHAAIDLEELPALIDAD